MQPEPQHCALRPTCCGQAGRAGTRVSQLLAWSTPVPCPPAPTHTRTLRARPRTCTHAHAHARTRTPAPLTSVFSTYRGLWLCGPVAFGGGWTPPLTPPTRACAHTRTCARTHARVRMRGKRAAYRTQPSPGLSRPGYRGDSVLLPRADARPGRRLARTLSLRCTGLGGRRHTCAGSGSRLPPRAPCSHGHGRFALPANHPRHKRPVAVQEARRGDGGGERC